MSQRDKGSSGRHRFDAKEVDELLQTGGGVPDSPDSDLWIGRELGIYRIVRFLADGGMSKVYVAERCDGQFEMEVAVKLIDAPSQSKLVEKFGQEQRILAALDHPNIARILDGGMASGQPYLVMELIAGLPIDEYANRHRLSVWERVALMEQVCDAVHYSHGNLVVHRDIKPGNILVDVRGQVKLLDFGIARRLTSAGDRDGTMEMMTPRFASPEMVSGQPANVSSDIYQLGLLLYLLLVGRHAQDPATGSLAEIARVVLEDDPKTPSERFDTTKRDDMGAAAEIARQRATRPRRLHRLLSGDLDAIVFACLRKQPGQRYSDVSKLLEDLKAARECRPIRARTSSPAFRLGRFVRRHRGAVSVLSVLSFALFASVVSLLLSWRQTFEAQERALQEARRVQEVTRLMVETLQGVDPDIAQGYDLTVAEMLEQASRRAHNELLKDPLTNATLRGVIGELYWKLGRLDEARSQLETALALHSSAGGSSAQFVSLKQRLAVVLLGLGDVEASELVAAEALGVGVENLGSEHELTLSSKRALIDSWIVGGRYEEALEATKSMLAQARDRGGLMANLHALEQLARIYTHKTDYSAARATYESAIALHRERLEAPSILLATMLRALGAIITYQGDGYDAAVAAGEEALTVTRQLLGQDHVSVAIALSELAGHHSQAGRFGNAEKALEEAAEISKLRLPHDHTFMATLWNNLAVLRFRQERFDEASAFYTRSIGIYTDKFGNDHPQNVSTRLFRAYGWHLAGDPRAESEYRALMPVIERVRGPDHAHMSHVLIDLGRLLVESGRNEEALSLLERGLDIRRNRYGEDSQLVADARLYLGGALSELGRFEEAEVLLEHAITRRKQVTGFKKLRVQEAQLYQARHFHRSGRQEEARQLLQLTFAEIEAERQVSHWLYRTGQRIAASLD